MQYSALFRMLKKTINRTPDIQDELASHFINLGLKRIERKLRLDIQIKTVTLPLVDNKADLPFDLLSFVKVSDQDGELPRISPLSVKNIARGFYVDKNQIISTRDAESIEVQYYSTYQRQTENSTSTQLGDNLPDLVLYAALTYIAEYFEDPRQASFANTFETLVKEYEAADRLAKLSGKPVVRNPYEGLF